LYKSYEHPEITTEIANKRIIKQEYINGKLKIDVATIDDCATPDSGICTIKNDTIYLDYYTKPLNIVVIKQNDSTTITEEHFANIACDVYYEMQYEISKIENKDYKIFLKGEQIKINDKIYKPATYLTIKSKHGTNDSIIIYDEDGFVYSRTYYDDWTVKQLIKKKYNYKKIFEYFPSGKLKMEKEIFYFDSGEIEKENIKEWNEKGKLLGKK